MPVIRCRTRKSAKVWWSAAALLVLLGCAGSKPPGQPGPNARDSGAVVFFKELDRLVEAHGVQDASRFRVVGFPYLRCDRFSAAMKDRVLGREEQRYWLLWMQRLDLASRRKEIANLPPQALTTLAGSAEAGGRTAWERARFYSDLLLQEDGRDPFLFERVKQAVLEVSEYSTVRRIAGLYPLAGIPVTVATAGAYSRYRKWHASPPGELPAAGELKSFAPGSADDDSPAQNVAPWFGPGNLDAFGLPMLTEARLRALFTRFAPVFTQDIAGPYDRFGAVHRRGDRIAVDGTRPVVYYYLSHAFLEGKPVLQLNYAVWYSERTGKETPWIEKGPLDGLTCRVTLSAAGEPAMIDVMNNCGCYHFFVPRKAAIQKVRLKPGELEPLVPAWMPENFPQERLVLNINSGWHQAVRISAGAVPSDAAFYELLPYETLESLPGPDGFNQSAFDSDGIMKDSWRIEPYLFFSMGISKVGYMRQRGRHAIKLVGRDHFTNPFLFDNNFIYTGQE